MKQSYIIIALIITLSTVSCGWFDTIFDSRTKANDAVLLQSVQTLVFQQNKHTTGRRNSPIPQMQCISNNKQQLELCTNHAPNSIMCKNIGFDGSDVTWQCTAELDSGVKLGNVDVICEGFDSPNDPYILKGSCAVEYTLTGQPQQHVTETIYQAPTQTYNAQPKTTLLEPEILTNTYYNTKNTAKSYIGSIMDTLLPSPINRLFGREPVKQSLTSRIMDSVFGYSIGSSIYNKLFGYSPLSTVYNTFTTPSTSIYNTLFGSNKPATPLQTFAQANKNVYDDDSSFLTTLLFYILTAVILYSIYKTLTSGSNTTQSNRRVPRRSDRSDYSTGNNNDDSDDNDDLPPPSYGASYDHPTDTATKRRTRTTPRTTTRNNAQSGASSGSGFYSGAALGALGGYLFGNRRSGTQTQSIPQQRAVYTEPTTHTYTSVPTQSTQTATQPTVVRTTAPSTTTSTAYATTRRR